MTEPRTILIVEDATSCATTLEIAITRIGNIEVQVVPSAEQARAVLDRDCCICALVTDLHLRAGTGLELIRWVRSRQATSRMPIIVISGDSDPETPGLALQSGANAYFAKPFSPAAVKRRLEDLIDADQGASGM